MLHFPSPDIGMFGRRQRHVRGHRIPVTIVTSSGGLSQAPDTATVVDTFGADDVALPGAGCQCCTVRVALQRALRRLLAERQKGRNFSRVVIETREDTDAILRTFATERALGLEFYVEDAPPLAGNRFTLTEDAPVRWDAFTRFMATLMALRGADLLWVEGLLNVENCRGPVAARVMGHLAHPPVELQAWPSDDRVSRLQFVTRAIPEAAVRSLLDSIRALS